MSAYEPEPPVRYRLGGLDLAIISDGYFLQDVGGVMGVVPRVMWEPVIGPPDATNRMHIPLNTLVVRSQGKTILIDTGVGAKLTEKQRAQQFPGDYGYLLRQLAQIAVKPEDVDAVINTHLHFDHCGWNTAQVHGRPLPTFPNAQYYIQRGEFDAAMKPNERTRGSYLPENYQPLNETGQLQLVEGEQHVTNEIVIVPAPGHTEDHAAVVISAGGETAIFVGDIAQHNVQLERAPWIAAFDTLPLVSLATKKRLVQQAIESNALVIGPHVAYPGAGRFHDVEGRRKLVSEPPLPPHAH
jgi:glyoxylase-like metal-dependent hydrolase (beta-lactamase superfamily II)